MSEAVAVVDLGTHSCLLLIGRLDSSGEIDVLVDRCEIPRLGEGLDATHAIGRAAIERIEVVIESYMKAALKCGCQQFVVGGTAALRRASNQADVVARIEALPRSGGYELKVDVEVIAEEREAKLGWMAAAGADASTVVFDVGGGSTEIVLDSGRLLKSVPIGATVLSERCGASDWSGLLSEARRAMKGLNKSSLGDQVRAINGRNGLVGVAPTWVALGGTASNLASLELGLPHFCHRSVEGALCGRESAARWGEHLSNLSLGERIDLPIEAARASLLPAGLACMAAVLELWGPPQFRVTGHGLRYGLLRQILVGGAR